MNLFHRHKWTIALKHEFLSPMEQAALHGSAITRGPAWIGQQKLVLVFTCLCGKYRIEERSNL